MDEYTKKQIAAIKNIIAVEDWRCNKGVQVGLVKDHGYSVCGAYISFHAPDDMEIPGLPTSDRATRSIFEFIRGNRENGCYYMVEEPFAGKIALSKFRKQIADNALTGPKRERRIMLSAWGDIEGVNQKINGMFNADYLKYAVESVGKNPAVYIGFRDNKQRVDSPFCLVVGGGGLEPFEKVCAAMVAGYRWKEI